MRDVKFRAWLPDEKIIMPVTRLTIIDDWVGCSNEERSGGVDKHGTAIIEQFTGLLDKAGKEIYEGDILRYYEYGDPAWPVVVPIIDLFEWLMMWQYNISEGGAPDDKDCPGWYEVVGNIHENPELLKGV